jgi:hypothetical protein
MPWPLKATILYGDALTVVSGVKGPGLVAFLPMGACDARLYLSCSTFFFFLCSYFGGDDDIIFFFFSIFFFFGPRLP